MIKWNDGTIDNRRVMSKYSRMIAKYVIVVNEDGTFEELCVDDSNSSSATDHIYGGSLTQEIVIDATPEDKMRWRVLHNIPMNGDEVRIIRGRKYKGEVKTFREYFKNYYQVTSYKRIETLYAKFTDGTFVNAEYIKLENPKGESK